ncbi:MAG: glycosyltransferase family 4 protein [Rhodocyclaceae bacterium]|nr:glycosyltransferase family 4 protein [Rhodocyclaceae bacterium]
MRLLVFSQYFWPENFRINDLVSHLVADGLEVTVLTGKPNYPDGKVFSGYRAWGIRHERHAGAEVIRLPLVPRGSRSGLRLAINYLSFVLAGYLLAPFALRGKPFDAVFVYAPSPLLQALPAILLAWLKRAPLIVWVQDLWPESLSATGHVKNRFLLRMVATVVRYIYRHTDSILIQSEAFRVPVGRLVRDTEKVRFFPNAVETAAPSSAVPSDEIISLSKDIEQGFSVVFAGNLGTAQSVETIVAAAERLRAHADVRFFLVGSGSRVDWLRAEIDRRGLSNVILPGRFPSTAMSGLYAAASALLVTLRDEAIFAYTIPSKLQGYLAAGRPVIAALNGEGARVVTEARAGVSCAAGDADALAAAVLHLRSLSPPERAVLGDNGRRYAAEHYSLERLASELVGHLEGLTAARRENRT